MLLPILPFVKKPVHSISTLSVFGEGRGLQVPLMETDDLLGLKVHGGYSQSKWVADRIFLKVNNAHEDKWSGLVFK